MIYTQGKNTDNILGLPVPLMWTQWSPIIIVYMTEAQPNVEGYPWPNYCQLIREDLLVFFLGKHLDCSS